MSNALLFLQNMADLGSVAASSQASALLAAANVQDSQRSVKWRSGAGYKSQLNVVLPAPYGVNYAAVVDTNLRPTGRIRVESWASGLDKHVLRDTVGAYDFTFARSGNTATRINELGLIEAVPADCPRFDYDPVTLALRGVLFEEPRTNLAWPSENFSHANFVKTDTTVTVDARVAPDGTTTMDLLTQGSAGNSELIDVRTGTANASYAMSRYFARGNHDWVLLAVVNGGNYFEAWFNLATGAAGSSLVGGTGTLTQKLIEPGPNGTYRCTIVGTVGSGATALSCYTIGTTADGGGTRVNGGTRYEWGAQFEDNATSRSSYIPAPTAATTRNAETCYLLTSGLAGFVNSAYSATIEWRTSVQAAPTSVEAPVVFHDDTTNELTTLKREATTALATQLVIDGGTQQANYTIAGAIAASTVVRLAGRFVASNFAFSKDGGSVASFGSGTMPNTTKLNIGHGINAAWVNGHIRKLTIHGSVVDADLVTLSGGGTIASAPTANWDFTVLPGEAKSVSPTVYLEDDATSVFGAGSFGSGGFGGTPLSVVPVGRNVTLVPMSQARLHKYWRITFEDSQTSYQECGRLFLGTPLEFRVNMSYDWEIHAEERSVSRESIGGQRYTEERDSRGVIAGQFDWLSDVERTTFLRRYKVIGDTEPIIFSIVPDGSLASLTTTLYGRFERPSVRGKRYDLNQLAFQVIEEL